MNTRTDEDRPNPMGWLMATMSKLPGMMSCREADGFLHDYLDGTLPKRTRRVFEFHLWMCPDCRRYLDAYRKTIELGRKAFEDPEAPAGAVLPEEMVTAIVKATESGGKERP